MSAGVLSETRSAMPRSARLDRLRWALADGYTITRRNLAHIRHVPEKLLGVTIMPVVFVLLFGYVFGSAISIPGGEDYRSYLLPGIFVVTVVWLGARFAVQGRISPGELVAFYGYAAFLMIPLRTATEFANKWIRAFVAARRVIRVLALEPEVASGTGVYDEPPVGAELSSFTVYQRSGL